MDIHKTSPEKFVHKLSQDELLKQIEENYETSTTFTNEVVSDSLQQIENIQTAPASIMDSGTEKYDLEKLHVRNSAQLKHTHETEKTALAHWAK